MHDIDVHAALVNMPEVSRALARGDAMGAYRAIRKVCAPIQAGRVLHALTQTVPDWEERANGFADGLAGEARRRSYGKVRNVTQAHAEPDAELTPRELSVLTFTAGGYSCAETAELIGLAYETVQMYRKRALAKLRAANSAQAVHIAHQRGLLK